MSDQTHPKLTGSWRGTYTYKKQREPVGFDAVFIEQNGAVQGSILDCGSLGEANVTGTFNFPELSFQKSYYNSSLDKVSYQGTMSSDGKKLSGKWRIQGTMSGDDKTFRISFSSGGNWVAFRQNGEGLIEKIETEECEQEERERSGVMVETA